MEKKVIIDEERCKGCELCVFYCPKKCLGISDKLNKLGLRPAKLNNPENCNSCGICYMMCPEYAVEVKKGDGS